MEKIKKHSKNKLINKCAYIFLDGQECQTNILNAGYCHKHKHTKLKKQCIHEHCTNITGSKYELCKIHYGDKFLPKLI